MKTLLPLVILMVLSLTVRAQSGPYSRVLFNPTPAEKINISVKGVALDHLHETPEGYIGEFSKEETEIILGQCKSASVLVHDLSQHFVQNTNKEVSVKRQSLTYPVPSGFRYGSMGGYLTLAQADSHINALIKNFPSLISKKDSIGTSIEGRTIYAFKVSDNPNLDEDEAEVLYTALHHAREPMSLMQMIYFLYYVTENYGKDPEIAWIVNKSEMYFIPVVNPDGYYYNESISPNGGGMWRKNRRNNMDGSFGVDLNRNYGFLWGLNDTGSSPATSSDVYRGPSGFSEPETQAVRNFCSKRKFYTALNYHTWGDKLIYPWGNDLGRTSTVDSTQYRAHASFLTVENNYKTGTCMQLLFYRINGCTDDWMYGEQSTKNKIFALTPEVGGPFGNGFWPPMTQILPDCDISIRQNINLAKIGIDMHPETPATNIENINTGDVVSVFPNPSSGEIHIMAARNIDADVFVFDCTGRLVFSGKPADNHIDLSFLDDGMYYCHINLQGNTVLNQQVMIIK